MLIWRWLVQWKVGVVEVDIIEAEIVVVYVLDDVVVEVGVGWLWMKITC